MNWEVQTIRSSTKIYEDTRSYVATFKNCDWLWPKMIYLRSLAAGKLFVVIFVVIEDCSLSLSDCIPKVNLCTIRKWAVYDTLREDYNWKVDAIF